MINERSPDITSCPDVVRCYEGSRETDSYDAMTGSNFVIGVNQHLCEESDIRAHCSNNRPTQKTYDIYVCNWYHSSPGLTDIIRYKRIGCTENTIYVLAPKYTQCQ